MVGLLDLFTLLAMVYRADTKGLFNPKVWISERRITKIIIHVCSQAIKNIKKTAAAQNGL